MKIGAAFPGQYLKAADLQGKRVAVIIDHVEMEDIGGETKPVLHFKGKSRGVVLNKTNANAIWAINGSDDTDDWGGTNIVLYPSKTDFQGKRVDCIRVDPPENQPVRPPQRPALRLQPITVEPLSDDDQGDDQSVPF
jgi:hypothetical protein